MMPFISLNKFPLEIEADTAREANYETPIINEENPQN
jgi:hypothetical protein